MKRNTQHGWIFIMFLAALAAGCGNGDGSNEDAALEDGEEGADGSDTSVDDGGGDAPADGVDDTVPADIDYDDSWFSDVCNIFYCQAPHVYQCGNCLDDEEEPDGAIDSHDSQCLGPCDNNEAGFNTEIPGGNSAPCKQDCYFDQDSGDGNDQCKWDHRCDELQPLELNPCNYDVPCDDCDCEGWFEAQSETCLELCLPLVPNGCDCFGCCELRGSGEYVFIGSPGCSLDNEENCTPCTYVPSCYNDCGYCEICLGKTEIPADCFPDDRCPPGVQACGLPGDPPCPEGYYCITGCCAQVPI
jgi:hypothetical protein